VAFSPDNRVLAKLAADKVSFWDVPTGRLLRNVDYTNNPSFQGDTLWFTQGGDAVEISAQATHDLIQVNVQTGDTVTIKGPPMDWTTYTYKYRNWTQTGTFINDKSKKKLVYKSADGNKSLVISKIPGPMQIEGLESIYYAYDVETKDGKKFHLDSNYMTSFGFSSDSRYLYLNQAVYDLQTGQTISKTVIAPYSGSGVGFLPGTHIPVTCGYKSIRIWNFPDVEDIELDYMMDFHVAPGSKVWVAEQFDEKRKEKRYSIVDAQTKSIKNSFNIEDFMWTLQDVDKDGERLSFFKVDADMKDYTKNKTQALIVNTATGELETTVPKTLRGMFTSNRDEMLVDSMFMYSFKHNLSTGERQRFPASDWTSGTTFSAVSNDLQYILALEYFLDSTVVKVRGHIFNSTTGKKEFTQVFDSCFSIFGFEMSSDHRYMAIGSVMDYDIFIYDLTTGKQVHRLQGHEAILSKFAFSDDNKRLISSSIDGTKRVWDLEKGIEMFALVSTGEKDYAIVTPQKYYFATKGAQKYIHFVKGQEIFPFEQFDLKYNRPDIILETMEASNQDLKEPFYNAYLKRLQRLGYSEEMLTGEFHLPKISVTNKESLPLITANQSVTLDISAIDSKYLVDRIMVRINGVPVSGSKGLDVKSEKLQHIKKSLDIKLSQGINHISVSVLNEKGVESIPVNVEISHASGSGQLPVLHLVTIGVSEYRNPEFNLSYAAKDSRDLMTLYSNSSEIFSAVVHHHFENAEVTTPKLTEIRSALEKTNENDVVCVFFAGHGLLDENLDYYLAAHNVNFQNPSEGGIPYGALESLLDGIPARKKILMLDACHSGEIDKDEVAWAEDTTAMVVEDGDLAFRAVTTSSLKQVGLQNSFELMKELFSDIRKSSGTVIISSAGGTEYAMEGGAWNNGVFTYSLLSGIGTGAADLNKDGKIMVNELSNYIHDNVVELTAGRQSPTNRAENHDSDWRMW
jgi:WD40 repeat protein